MFESQRILLKALILFNLDIGNDTAICPRNTLILESNHDFWVYSWSTGATTGSITISEAGTYILTAGNGCESVSDTVVVDYFSVTEPRFPVSPTYSTPVETVKFQSLNDGVDSIYWDYGEGTSEERTFGHLYQRNGVFLILYQITDTNGCTFKDSAAVTINLVTVHIPNSMTPNGDGLNDVFGPVGFGIASYHIKIFNRWGELIFERENEPWDGRLNGRIAPLSVYVYDILVTDDFGKDAKYWGTVGIVR